MRTKLTVGIMIVVAGAGYLAAPRIDESLDALAARIGIALLAAFLVNFTLLTPFRMWRDAVSERNVDEITEELIACRAEGWELYKTPVERSEIPDHDEWVSKWAQRVSLWDDRTSEALMRLHPPQSAFFKSLRPYDDKRIFVGLTSQHERLLSVLLKRLEFVDSIVGRLVIPPSS